MARYIDSEDRSASSALGAWLETEATGQIAHLRLQTGYFALNGLAPLAPTFANVSAGSVAFSAVIGSNEGDTLGADIESVCDLLGLPNSTVSLGIASFSSGLFHPKVVHFARADGSQAAYVGSANLTEAGVTGLNIEAGLILDSSNGDDMSTLQDIADRVDSWFAGGVAGLYPISDRRDVQPLVAGGVLSANPTRTRAPRVSPSSGTGSGISRPSLRSLTTFASLASGAATTTSTGTAVSVPSTPAVAAPTPLAPAITPPTPNDVLIAEIGGGPRWKQANFPISIMQNFFGVNPPSSSTLELTAVDIMGGIESVVNTPTVSVKSQNYRIELGSVTGISYPGNSDRPIGVFKRTAAGKFRYRVFFRAETGYSNLETYLSRNYTGSSHHLKRIITDSPTLAGTWSGCPV